MSNSHSDELRELIAKLSDGSLSVEEAGRLNGRLKEDAIAQEAYLDHFLIDGLLEREFSGAASRIENLRAAGSQSASPEGQSIARRVGRLFRLRSTRQILAAVFLIMMVAVGRLVWTAERGKLQPIELANMGFESETPPAEASLNTAWYGDTAEVVGRFEDVTPLEGSRMLRFVKSAVEPANDCEIYQIVDLSTVAGAIASRPVSIEACAFFNSIDETLHEADYTFRITVFAFSGDPTKQPHVRSLGWKHALAFSGSQARADANSKTWQPVTTRLSLPVDTKYVIVQLAIVGLQDANGEFPGQFADSVKLNLVSLR